MTITQRTLNHLRRDSKQARGAAMSEVDIERLPDIIAEPQAVLWDNQKSNLLFVLAADGKKQGKVAVEVEHPGHTKLANTGKQRMITNSIRSAGYVDTYNLREAQYDVLTGDLR